MNPNTNQQQPQNTGQAQTAGAQAGTPGPGSDAYRQAAATQQASAGQGGKVIRPAQSPSAGNPNSTQNALEIAEIRDGIVIMNDGSFRSVIMAKSINFDLMSPEERNAVEYSYQGFLNSLYFPVQIHIHSTRVDIRPYLKKLDKIRQEHDNMLLSLLMEDYLAYISDLASQTNIMDKKFYIVVPFFSTVTSQKALTQSKNFFSGLTSLFKTQNVHVVINEKELAKAKEELKKRVAAVMDGLRQCGVSSLPLDTQELIELYYDSYNPDTATRQQLKGFEGMDTPVVRKGEGEARQPNLEKELQQ